MEFGRDFLERVWALPEGEWQGPIDSRIGMHYVRLLARHPASYSEFEQIEDYLRQDWEFSKRRALQQEKIDELRTSYRIEYVDATK
jgi:parvulin-like peptidyl-prolyl isomerase